MGPYSIIIISYLISAVIPIVFWFWFFLRQDRAEPEPKRILLKTFLWGIVAVTLATIAGKALSLIFFSGEDQDILRNYILGRDLNYHLSLPAIFLLLFLAGPIEEGIKYLVFKNTTYKERSFNQTVDGVVYGIALALGFAFVENTIYFMELFSYLDTSEFSFILILRGFASILVHVIATGIMGFYMGQAKFARAGKTIMIAKGVIIAMLLHGIFNLLLQFAYPLNAFLAFSLVLLALIYLVVNIRKPESKVVWKLTEN